MLKRQKLYVKTNAIRWTCCFVLFLCTKGPLHAQADSTQAIPPPKRSLFDRYWQFLQPDSTRHNTYFLAAFNFMYTQQGYVSHGGRGTYLSAGLNVGRLFSKKIVLGASIELKAWKGLWPVYFSKNFVMT